jgi:GNAT superfamily N-acetyltransferase
MNAREAGMRIRECVALDSPAILAVVNDAAQVYRGVIPADRWREPYMSSEELADAMSEGIAFHAAEDEGGLCGVMGMQDKGELALVRHAYVVPGRQRRGVGTHLLRHLEALAAKPMLIGTWAAASWAIDFYVRSGYVVVDAAAKDALLRRYWRIPERQIETSVVLADRRWQEATQRDGGQAPSRA